MFFRRKKAQRLYYPSKSKWYTKPKKKAVLKRRKNNTYSLGKKIKSSFYFLLILIFILSIALLAFFSLYLTITKIEVLRGDFNVNSASVENYLNNYIGKNIIFTPKAEIAKTISDAFPEFDTIKINKKFPSSIQIELGVYPAVTNLRYYYIPKIEEEIINTEDFTELNKAIEDLSGDLINIEDLID